MNTPRRSSILKLPKETLTVSTIAPEAESKNRRVNFSCRRSIKIFHDQSDNQGSYEISDYDVTDKHDSPPHKKEKRSHETCNDDFKKISEYQVADTNIKSKRRTITFNGTEADLELTQVAESIFDNKENDIVQPQANVVVKNKRATILFGEHDDKMEITIANDAAQIDTVRNKRMTIVFDDQDGEMEMTIANDAAQIDTVRNKRTTIVFAEQDNDMNLTLCDNTSPGVGVETNKRKTIVFEEHDNDMDMTLQETSILKTNELRQHDECYSNKDLISSESNTMRNIFEKNNESERTEALCNMQPIVPSVMEKSSSFSNKNDDNIIIDKFSNNAVSKTSLMKCKAVVWKYPNFEKNPEACSNDTEAVHTQQTVLTTNHLLNNILSPALQIKSEVSASSVQVETMVNDVRPEAEEITQISEYAIDNQNNAETNNQHLQRNCTSIIFGDQKNNVERKTLDYNNSIFNDNALSKYSICNSSKSLIPALECTSEINNESERTEALCNLRPNVPSVFDLTSGLNKDDNRIMNDNSKLLDNLNQTSLLKANNESLVQCYKTFFTPQSNLKCEQKESTSVFNSTENSIMMSKNNELLENNLKQTPLTRSRKVATDFHSVIDFSLGFNKDESSTIHNKNQLFPPNILEQNSLIKSNNVATGQSYKNSSGQLDSNVVKQLSSNEVHALDSASILSQNKNSFMINRTNSSLLQNNLQQTLKPQLESSTVIEKRTNPVTPSIFDITSGLNKDESSIIAKRSTLLSNNSTQTPLYYSSNMPSHQFFKNSAQPYPHITEAPTVTAVENIASSTMYMDIDQTAALIDVSQVELTQVEDDDDICNNGSLMDRINNLYRDMKVFPLSPIKPFQFKKSEDFDCLYYEDKLCRYLISFTVAAEPKVDKQEIEKMVNELTKEYDSVAEEFRQYKKSMIVNNN
ncbi:uncharacterized protein LOC113373822 [Ctenocephalides felis]|uniref:uncharacterized protein LOC113373822 n=1 Tax=Ctenocephalides felis TaxID=7515 RepID=UPI000E6E11EE|nr:uncharacterized protein LOC113373822 [Ctenocephalides felis]